MYSLTTAKGGTKFDHARQLTESDENTIMTSLTIQKAYNFKPQLLIVF